MTGIRTTCAYCGVGCGIVATPAGATGVGCGSVAPPAGATGVGCGSVAPPAGVTRARGDAAPPSANICTADGSSLAGLVPGHRAGSLLAGPVPSDADNDVGPPAGGHDVSDGAGAAANTAQRAGGDAALLITGRDIAVCGDSDHPANRGRLCSKGTHLGETVGLAGRLLHPMIGGTRVPWDTALSHVAERFAATIAEHGPDAVAFYVSGQLLTEDYYVANKLMKGFIGAGNIDTNSRLCMASAVAGHRRAFGADVVPASYDDLELADLVVLVGSNSAWCHPVLYQRLLAARARRGTRVVVIDPRRTETCADADLHLAIRPGSDLRLFNGLLAHLVGAGVLDQRFIADHVAVPTGYWERLVRANPVRDVARDCDIAHADLVRFYALFAATPRTVTLFSMGINQQVAGTDTVNAIINCHLATGRIGKPGAAPFSITGQPNAMGGREVGGLATQLAAHMSFDAADVDRVARFWRAPAIARKPGLAAVDLFRAVDEGRIKALWVMATNPAASLPDASAVRAALAKCPLVVVSDCIAATDTLAHAHVALPALGWGEKDGTVTNSERRISRQRALFAAPGEARPDWWIVSELAKRMGFGDAFDYAGAAAIFREHAALSAFENDGRRPFNLRHLADMSDAEYAALQPCQWGGPRPFADGRFATPDGRARIIEVQPTARAAQAGFPFILNSGRLRDQWHTMTRTGLSPKLAAHRREPMVDVHPDDAQRLGLVEAGFATVSSPHGRSVYRVRISDDQRVGELFVPIHWTDQQSSAGRTGLLAQPAVDPVSFQPGFKHTRADIVPYAPCWRGFLIVRGTLPADSLPHAAASPAAPRPQQYSGVQRAKVSYWTRSPIPDGTLVELAGDGDPTALTALLPPGDRLEAHDRARGSARWAVLDADRVAACLFVTRDGKLPDHDWLIRQLAAATTPNPLALLAGRTAGAPEERGPTLCACFDVGVTTIVRAIATHKLTSVEAVGAALRAGTNCGSCRPAIAKLLMPAEELSHAS